MNAVSYLRVSSDGQQDGDGWPRQCERCDRYGDDNGIRIVNVFLEHVSGRKDSTDRPAFQAMIEYCKVHDIKAIIIEKWERWMRDLLVGELLLMQCRELGISVIDASTGMNMNEESDDPYVKAIRRVMGVFCELNRDVLVSNMAKARERKRKENGKCDGSKAYGERETDNPEVIERIVRERKELRLSYRLIAERLESDGVPTQRGGQWHGTTVRKIYQRNKETVS